MRRSNRNRSNKAALRSRNRRHRRLITFGRILRYGGHNFVRNAWLSIAASLIMSITLAVILVSALSNRILSDTVEEIRSKVDMSIYVKHDTPGSKAKELEQKLHQLSNVKAVKYISSAEARKSLTLQNTDSDGVKEALTETGGDYDLPGNFQVSLNEIDQTQELEDFIARDKLMQEYLHPDRKPSFLSDRREIITNISRTANFAEKIGILATVIFTAIAVLVVFNTIRMAIFNRRDEIYMMRLIGAEPTYIQGPFLVEAAINGVLASIIAFGVVKLGFSAAYQKLESFGVSLEMIKIVLNQLWFLVLLVTAALGATIGVFSAMLATRAYLKEKIN